MTNREKTTFSKIHSTGTAILLGAFFVSSTACGNASLSQPQVTASVPDSYRAQASTNASSPTSPIFYESEKNDEPNETTEPEINKVLIDDLGLECSSSSLLIYFNEPKSDEEAEAFCKAHDVSLVYNYNLLSGIAVSLKTPAKDLAELNTVINELAKDNSVISVEKDYIMKLDNNVGFMD